jgi:hypothetical protein
MHRWAWFLKKLRFTSPCKSNKHCIFCQLTQQHCHVITKKPSHLGGIRIRIFCSSGGRDDAARASMTLKKNHGSKVHTYYVHRAMSIVSLTS